MSEQTLHLVQIIRQRLQAATRRITLADLLYGLLLTIGLASAIGLLSVAVEAGFWLGSTPRSVLFWVFLLVMVGMVGYFLVLPLLRLLGVLRGPSEEVVARRIGTRYPEVSDRLVNMLHLVEGRRTEAPAPLIDGAVQMLGEQVQAVPFERVEDFARAKKAGRLASLPIVGLLLFLLVAPSTFLDASKRLFSPNETFQRPAPFTLDVQPGSLDLVKGATLDVTVYAAGSALPREVLLSINNLDEDHVEEIRLTADSTGAFRHSLVNVRKSLRYQVAASPVETAWYTATVTERPIVRSLQVGLAFPSYTGLPAQRLAPNVGDVTALPGTRVSLDVGISGNDIDAAFLRFDDGTLDTLALDTDAATGTFMLRREGTYQILLRNTRGAENSDPIVHSLRLLADAFPAIVLIEPDPLAELDDALEATLRVRINDDFGFSQMRLFYRLAESRYDDVMGDFESLPLPLGTPRQLDQELVHTWFIAQDTPLDPVPGDVIEYYVQVWDNDAFAGFKPTKSATHRLRLPSLAERYEELDDQQDETEEEMEDLLQNTESIRKQFEELRDELREKQEGDWEDKRQVERLQEQQQQLEERVEDVAEQIESMTDQMEEHNLANEETLEMYEELQRVAEEMNSPELMEALRELQEAMEQMDLQQMQESIQNFEMNEEMFQQRMERTLELFKRLQVQQKLEEASRRAEELAEQQERLAEETEKLMEEDPQAGEEQQEGEEQEGEQQEGEQQEGEQQEGEQQEGEQQEGEQQEGEQQQGEQNEGEQQEGEQQRSDQPRNEELAQEQERSAEEMKQLEEQMKEILERMEEMRNTPSDQMQQLNQQTQQQQIPQQMQQNAQQLQQQQMQDAQQGQEQMQQQLQNLQQQLQQMQQGMQGQQMQINMAGLRRSLSDILRLSQDQEALRGNVNIATTDSPLLRDFAQRQVELSEGLRVVSDSLQSLAKEIPQMTREVQKQAGDALRAMGESTESLSERSNREASGQQKTAMMHLNELALLLSDLMDQMMNSQMSGSSSMSMQQMIQQLQQMAGEQQKLNQQIQQMLNQMQGNRLSQDMQERLRQMAAQQESMRRQLKEMGRNRELNNEMMGDLNKIADQMEETIQEMQSKQLNRRTVRRQQQILTRLLDASKSMRERGKEKKREGRQADDIDRQSPAELAPDEQAEQLRRSLLRALESGYAPDYQELIKRYFELLQQKN